MRRDWSMRRLVLAAIALAALLAAFELRLDPRALIPSAGGLRLAGELLARAWSPALEYEASFVPEGAPPLPLKALQAAGQTVVFAAAATSLAVVVGLVLGLLGSSAWWAGDPVTGVGRSRRLLARGGHVGVRVAITLMRSIHELLWAILFLAAFGLSHLSAVIAIAIPYGGTLAKVFSEMLDEAPREAALALRTAGAAPAQVFLFGLLPRALPDMAAYTFYRFECALRASAVLGFFGFPTLGYYVFAAFENLHYGEVWTYLYTLAALVVAVELWSGALRRRLAR